MLLEHYGGAKCIKRFIMSAEFDEFKVPDSRRGSPGVSREMQEEDEIMHALANAPTVVVEPRRDLIPPTPAPPAPADDTDADASGIAI